MKKETANDLKELLILNSELFNVYQDLELLDINNMRNTSDFRKKVTRVKEIRNLTDTIIDRISSDNEELKKVMKYLDEELGLDYDPNEIENLMCFGSTAEQMVPMRTLNSLNKCYSVTANIADIYAEDGIDVTDEMLDYSSQSIKYRRYYGELTSNNVDTIVLAKIKKEGLFENERLSESFYRIKYDMAYLNTSIENELLKSNYEIDEYPYILRSGVNYFFGVDNKFAEEYKGELFESIIAGNLELLCKSDIEIVQDVFNGAEIITFGYCILAGLLLMDDEIEANKVIEKIKKVIERIDDNRSFIIVKNLLDIVINDYEDAKDEYQFISIGGR